MVSLRRGGAKPATKGPSRAEKKAARKARRGQFSQAFRMTRQADPKLIPYLAAVVIAVLAVFVLLAVVIGPLYLWLPIGIMFALLGGVMLFSRRAQAAAFSQVEGQPGAAAAVLTNMRGNWRVTPAVAFNKNQDLVHRVVGRPGVILVAEGSPGGTRALLGNEKRKLSRIVGAETPIYDIIVGDGEGQVPLRKLQMHVTKLPRNIKPAAVNGVDARLKAIGGASLPIPKGPIPMSGKIPRGKMR